MGDAQGVVDALEVITRDPQVRAIFFNIFGGITRCDEVARGILQAVERDVAARCRSSCGSTAPTREEGGASSRKAALPNLSTEATMLDGARRAVELAA